VAGLQFEAAVPVCTEELRLDPDNVAVKAALAKAETAANAGQAAASAAADSASAAAEGAASDAIEGATSGIPSYGE
jgi:hypothetical protein